MEARKRKSDGAISSKSLNNQIKARTMLDVLIETGRISPKEIFVKMYGPDKSAVNASRDIMKPEVFKEFYNLLSIDKKAMDKLGPDTVVRDILNDMHKLDLLIESPGVETAEVKNLVAAKTAKQKLLGSYLGIWNAEKQEDADRSDPNALFKRSQNLLN